MSPAAELLTRPAVGVKVKVETGQPFHCGVRRDAIYDDEEAEPRAGDRR
jgi:hypothetical protein